jgi:hypothetical protein
MRSLRGNSASPVTGFPRLNLRLAAIRGASKQKARAFGTGLFCLVIFSIAAFGARILLHF